MGRADQEKISEGMRRGVMVYGRPRCDNDVVKPESDEGQ